MDEPQTEDSRTADVGRRIGFGLKETVVGVGAVAGAVGLIWRRRSGESGSAARERHEDATLPGEDVSGAAIAERAESDVQAESPEPGEMIVDDDVVEDVVDEDVGGGSGEADPGQGVDDDAGRLPARVPQTRSVRTTRETGRLPTRRTSSPPGRIGAVAATVAD